MEYTLILPTCLGTITLANSSFISIYITQKVKINSSMGIILILCLCILHRLSLASAIASAWGIFVGYIVGLMFKCC